jgi:hypothetical protein
MYNANWGNWVPKEGDHLFKVDFTQELNSYGCKTTDIATLYPEPTKPVVAPPAG